MSDVLLGWRANIHQPLVGSASMLKIVRLLWRSICPDRMRFFVGWSLSCANYLICSNAYSTETSYHNLNTLSRSVAASNLVIRWWILALGNVRVVLYLRDGGRLVWRAMNEGEAMFGQAFRNIDDVLWKEAGCTTELDYTEQTSWLLFLKYLDGLEQDKAAEAGLRLPLNGSE